LVAGEEPAAPKPPAVVPPRPPDQFPQPPPTKPRSEGEYYAALAEVHASYEVFDEAEKCFTRAIEVEKAPEEAARLQYRLALLYIREKKDADAAAMLQLAADAVQDKEAKVRYMLQLAQLLDRGPDAAKAEEVYKKVLGMADKPWDRTNAMRALIRFYNNTKRVDKAIEEYEKKLAEKPDDDEALQMLGEIYSTVKVDDAKAASVYEKLIKTHPDDVSMQDRLAQAYERMKQPDKAVALFEKLLNEQPQRAAYYHERIAGIYMAAGKKDKALEWAKKLSERGQPTPSSLAHVAQIYTRLEMHKEAAAQYQEAIKLTKDPDEIARYKIRWAQSLELANDFDGAKNLYEQVIKEAPGSYHKTRAEQLLMRMQKRQEKPGEGGQPPAPPKPEPPKPDK
jgi:tetratricopeptide (TPR) repeat protein